MGMRMLSGKLNDAQSRINWVMIGAGILWVSIPDIGCTWETVLISSNITYAVFRNSVIMTFVVRLSACFFIF